jgi:hypothetical protein
MIYYQPRHISNETQPIEYYESWLIPKFSLPTLIINASNKKRTIIKIYQNSSAKLPDMEAAKPEELYKLIRLTWLT